MARVTGDLGSGLLDDLTSYPVEGAQFSKAYKKGLWDGRKRLMDRRTGVLPAGLVPDIVRRFDAMGEPVSVVDHRTWEIGPNGGSFDLEGITMTGKYAYQLDVCKTMVKERAGIVKVGTGGGKTEIASAVTKYLDLPTLFVVTNRELLYQARKRFQNRLGYGDKEVGLIGDGHWSPGTKVTIATVDTLESRSATQEAQDFLSSVKVFFVDEAHHMGSETWYSVATSCPATYRFGLSGTPLDRTDGANLRLIAATGPQIADIGTAFLVEQGVLAKAEIIFDRVTSPLVKKSARYPTAYKEGVVENEELLTKVIDWVKIFRTPSFFKDRPDGLGVLLLVEEIKHGKILDDALWERTGDMFIPHQFIWGEEDTDTRQQVLDDFNSRRLPVLISSTILDEGVDLQTIDVLIPVGSKKSKIRTIQRLGRGLRGEKLLVVEFANFTHKYLIQHSSKRWDDYAAEGCFAIHQSGPDANLAKTLWDNARVMR